ncbi:CDK-activating kinase assembly factor MAT1-domain-containing protein [Obelidium mucronatum]|nr:CDK-activating kinase assembly factor MAT1-domain-containing protein [Obelidium mucronatum]
MSKDKRMAAADSGDVCPVCKSDRYLNPNLRLLVSLCYHKMCESCINRLFLAGAAPCPICKTSLRKSNFVTQTFEDLRVEKEVHYRKKVGKFFNKRLEDFNMDQRKYDDYLEEVEDIMFNLANGVDVQATNERVERFRQENKDLIAVNSSRAALEERAISNKLKREREEKRIRREALLLHEMNESRSKEMEKQALIDELATSDKPPEEIIQAYKKRHLATTAASHSASTLENIFREAEYNLAWQDDVDFITGTGGGAGGDITVDDFDAFDHEYVDPLENLQLAGGYQDPWTMDIGVDRSARASGYIPQWSHIRAIQSSFYGILEGVVPAAVVDSASAPAVLENASK